MNLTRQIVLAILRHLLGYAGAYLVARGIVDAETAAAWQLEFSAELLGWLLMAGAILWSAFNKSNLRKRIAAALNLQPGATPEEIKTAASSL
jgi:hypothetical protein